MSLYISNIPEDYFSRLKRASSAFICSRCWELEIDVLLEKHVFFDEQARYWTTDGSVEWYMAAGIIKDLPESTYQKISWAIAQRLVFDREELLHSLCAACQALKTTSWNLRLRPIFCSQRYNFFFHLNNYEGLKMQLWTHRPVIRGEISMEPIQLGYPGNELGTCRLPRINKVRPLIDYALVKSWLDHCQDDHVKCRIIDSRLTDKLKNVRLLDVRERRLVSYTTGMEFLALSYVWGGAQQPIVAKEDEVPSTLPLTIEHAMTMVEKLSYRYLWVDSICIDQSDPIEKSEQIAAMDAIYSCASATLITLDSPHANSGIPGVVPQHDVCNPRTDQIVAFFRPQNKKVCPETDNELLLIANQPTLDEELSNSRWSLRAWTYQEALLSRRRIIIARHQVLFSCNQMDRSEDGFQSSQDRPLGAIRAEKLVNPLFNADLSSECRRFDAYSKLVGEYALRELTNDGDGLSAISAILSTWERELPCEKFLFALPRWAFREALLWGHEDKGTSNCERRRTQLKDLPSWSWCGWQLNHFVWFMNYPSLFGVQKRPPTILPPLFVSHDDEVLVSNCGDERDRKEPGLNDIDPIVAQSPLWMILAKVAEQKKELREANHRHQEDPNPCIRLTVQGILLRVPLQVSHLRCSEFNRRVRVNLDVEEHEIVQGSQMAYHDCLFLSINVEHESINVEHDTTVSCIILLWQDTHTGTVIRTAKRAGIIRLYYHRQQEFLDLWPRLDTRWEKFYLE